MNPVSLGTLLLDVAVDIEADAEFLVAGRALATTCLLQTNPASTAKMSLQYRTQRSDWYLMSIEACSEMGHFGLNVSVGVAILGYLLAPGQAAVPRFAAVYSFGVTATDAAVPKVGLVSVDHVLFGTSSLGGQMLGHGVGTIFRFDPATGAETVEYSFGTGPSFPGRLLALRGLLYGTTAVGAGGNGSVYSYDTQSHSLHLLHMFAGGSDGYFPTGKLTYWNEYLYGATSGGGLQDCPIPGEDTCGTVFRINVTSGQFQQLHAFANLRDGMTPTTGLQRLGHDFYGATATTIFALEPQSGDIRPVHRFGGGADAGSVSGDLVAFGGMLYGVTFTGGDDGKGALFALDTTNGGITILHSFTGGRLGRSPNGSVSFHCGKLYGSTQAGGRQDKGVIFQYDLSTGEMTSLHDFSGADGAAPNGDLLFRDGAFYGTTQQGGSANMGVIFRLIP